MLLDPQEVLRPRRVPDAASDRPRLHVLRVRRVRARRPVLLDEYGEVSRGAAVLVVLVAGLLCGTPLSVHGAVSRPIATAAPLLIAFLFALSLVRIGSGER